MKKFFNRALWSLLTSFFAIWLAIALIGENYALQYASTINNILEINPYEVIGETDPEPIYQSKYLKSDGSYNDALMRTVSEAVSEEVASDGAVLLWNNKTAEGTAALPLAAESRISIFGIGSVNYKFSGGGSGEIKASPSNNLKAELETSVEKGGAGFKVNGTLFNAYASLRSEYGTKNYQGSLTADPDYNGTNGYTDQRYREYSVNEVPWDVLNSKISNGVVSTLASSKNSKGYSDAAVMIITRDGSEDGDTWFNTTECMDNTYLDLSYEEAEILEELSALKEDGTIKKLIVILNTASVIQMKNLTKYGVDACVLAGCGGLMSFDAISNVLSGATNPSGRLVDTIAYDIDSAPAMENFGDFRWNQAGNLPVTDIGTYNNFYVTYQEGIYVGYRYYETRYEDLIMNSGNAGATKGVYLSEGAWKYGSEVAFPFGYGLSYTTFAFSNMKVKHIEGEYGGTYEVTVTVQNTGEVAGKVPVQVYLQKPYTQYDKTNGVEKSSVELVGFAKSPMIAAGKSVEVTVTVKGSDFKTYDTYGKETYILEAGDYYLSVAQDAHEAVNNILADKGYTSQNGMVDSIGKATNGDKELSYLIDTITKDDYTTYATSEYEDNVEITNQLSNGDLNLYSGTADQKITYLSRQDWEGTYPIPVSLSCTNAKMVEDMQYQSYTVPTSTEKVPTMGTITAPEEIFEDIKLAEGQEKRLTLALMVGKEYDDEAWEYLLDQLTWQEMNYLLCGGYLTLQGAISVGAPGGVAADGTSGVRVNNPTTGNLMGFPTATVMAQTWDMELIEKLGVVFGHECMHANVVQLYAPCGNLHRTPYGGRNWEYFSEDAFMSGKMLAVETLGIQSCGIIVTAKHFAFNEQEINRCGVATWLNEQTAREIYLKVFELAVTEGQTKALMSSFPRLGCSFEGHYSGLMTEILRNEWGFKGFVETDSAFDQKYMTQGIARIEGVICGVDFWMDGSKWMQFDVMSGASNNAVVVKAVREACHRVLYTQTNSLVINGMSTDSIIVYNMPWWEKAINDAQVVLGCITATLFALSVVSFVIHAFKKEN